MAAALGTEDDLLPRGGELRGRDVVLLGVATRGLDARVRGADERRDLHDTYMRINTY
jgi:hypothetical protein